MVVPDPMVADHAARRAEALRAPVADPAQGVPCSAAGAGNPKSGPDKALIPML